MQRLPISEWSAVYAVVRIDPASPEAQTLVIPIARHLRDATDEAERAQLTWLLDRSGPSANPAIPTLRAALQSPVNGVRRDAARLLGSLGPPAEPASADLAILSRQDPDPTVRTSAPERPGEAPRAAHRELARRTDRGAVTPPDRVRIEPGPPLKPRGGRVDPGRLGAWAGFQPDRSGVSQPLGLPKNRIRGTLDSV